MKRVAQSPYPEIIARNLRLLRAERGFSQEHVALEIEMHRSYLSGLEAGLHNPTVNLLARFEPVFGVSILDLMREEFFPAAPWRLPDAGQLAFAFWDEQRRGRGAAGPGPALDAPGLPLMRAMRGGRPC
jgi:transcriptional regulator with XRE-family HTH domain